MSNGRRAGGNEILGQIVGERWDARKLARPAGESRGERNLVSGSVALCYGTRPQVIKASRVRRALGDVGPVFAIDTGQHYDYALNELLYDQLGVAPPDLCLEVGSASHAEQTAAILRAIEPVFRERRPRAVVVIGDTNSTLGCALAAAKLRIPVVHVEAGLRAADIHMAEELNRRAVDAVASVLCTPSAAATERMRRERPDASTIETGDVAYDVLLSRLGTLPDVRHLLPTAADAGYAFATLHRAELTDCPQHLVSVLTALGRLPLPVVLALHPRTRVALESARWPMPESPGLRMMPAVGYLESLALAAGARAVITDSGGVQREAYWLGVPCITVRTETEWTETVELGANRLIPPEEAGHGLAHAVAQALAAPRGWSRAAYGDGTAAPRIAAAVAALIAQSAVPAAAD
jgi:UDP-N-acetylglucosamine 2-epimerase